MTVALWTSRQRMIFAMVAASLTDAAPSAAGTSILSAQIATSVNGVTNADNVESENMAAAGYDSRVDSNICSIRHILARD